MTTEQAINVLGVAILTLILESFVLIWSLNTLFKLDIQYDFVSFFASLFIVFMLKPSSKLR